MSHLDEIERVAPAVCSKRMGRGKCKREVVFYAEFFGRRHNACGVHLGDVLLEHGITRVTRATVFLRTPPVPSTPEEGS